jgi:hypothetical protein
MNIKTRFSMRGEINWTLAILCTLIVLAIYSCASKSQKQRADKNVMACREISADKTNGLEFAQSMASCLKTKNGTFENWRMRNIYSAIEHATSVNQAFVGDWLASQPGCTYEHKLYSDGNFVSIPKECDLNDQVYSGTWSAFDGSLIWLPNKKQDWTPDINKISNFNGTNHFSLTELNGRTTNFERIGMVGKSSQAMLNAGNTAGVAVAIGYQWAEENDIHDHEECRAHWIGNKVALSRMGCDKYVTKVNVVDVVGKEPDPRNYSEGATTAECQEEMHAYWDPIIADMKAKGEDHAADVWVNHNVLPALRECENIDRLRK